jgi:hypothetical protein
MAGDTFMINSAIQTVLGQVWLQGRLRYNYLSSDKVIAESVAFHENGQIRFQYPIHDNKIHGVCRIWYSDGVLQCEEIYVHNTLDGLKKEWHPNGQLKKEANYKNGMLDGLRKEWYETGVQRLQSFYIEDRIEGQYLEWYGNGHISRHFNFIGGRRQGIFKYGLPDGRLKRQEVYIRDIRIPLNIYRLINSKQLTAKDVLDIKNTAIRRICLEQLGYGRFLAQVDHQIIEKSGDYDLVKIDWHKQEEPIYLVKVKCPSTGAFYTLRVPPHVLTVKQAIAWTFNLKADEYSPEKET